jgi:RimJ/RimL family protein N-acetyltransferase
MAETVEFTLEQQITLRDGRKILLRAARPDDAVDLLDIQRQVFEEGISNVSDELETLEERKEEIEKLGEGRLWLVAEHNGKVVGSLELHRSPPVFLHHHLFLAIELHRKYRGGGIGSALMKQGAAWAKHHGYEFIRLGVLDSNPRAKALYERLGYRAYGHLPNFVKRRDGSYVGDTMMVLEL